jgi:hypothetical protein
MKAPPSYFKNVVYLGPKQMHQCVSSLWSHHSLQKIGIASGCFQFQVTGVYLHQEASHRSDRIRLMSTYREFNG